MKRAPEKIRERHWLESLRNHLPAIATAAVKDSERPDFILSVGQASIGVEVTEVCRPDLKKQDSLEARICDNARLEYGSMGGPPVWVSVLFSAVSLRKSDVPAVSTMLAQLVHRLAPAECPGSAEEAFDWDNSDYFPDVLASVAVRRVPQLDESFWAPLSSGWVPTLEPPDVADLISRKSPAATSYQQECDELWLLLVIDSFRVGSIARLSESAKAAMSPCAFDRVFVLTDHRLLDELTVACPQA